MRFVIKHEAKGRIRIHILKKRRMSFEDADRIQYHFTMQPYVRSVLVREKTLDVTICYTGSRAELIRSLQCFHMEDVQVPESYLQNSGREMNEQYKEKLINHVILRAGNKIFLPSPVRSAITLVKSVRYLWKGLKSLAARRLEVSVLDATAIGVSILRGDCDTAGSVMFLLGFGEILEEWTHKKSIGDLARSMSLNVSKVWLVKGEQQILVEASQIQAGDQVRVHMGNVIPFDGTVTDGDAMVNQSSLTGESLPVHKGAGSSVFAGTVIEDGELTICVKETAGSGKYDQIVTMIEESEKMKSALESRAEHLADRLVPYTFAGTILTWLLTRNVTKALSVLMVDFSCALKLAMPVSVLSAIREASVHSLTVKGGKYLEAVAEADTIVFDKTGTLTKACPKVTDVIPFNGDTPDELLRIAACLEEHFPHSMAKAVVEAAKAKNLGHEEMHSKVEYVVAHGISSMIGKDRVIIGSHHFVFEDEHCAVPDGMEAKFHQIPAECSHLYLAIDNRLAGVICIEDPLREEAAGAIAQLKSMGISKVVMMTGDSERTAQKIAEIVGVDEYYSEVLPEDKAGFIEKEKAQGRKVIMIGDGVNDSPALSASDAGIAISDGSELAREIADITIGADDLYQIVTLKAISDALMKRIRWNYRFIVGFNTCLILLGVGGILQPTTSALLHNTSTLMISLKSMGNLI
jgi:heavy metal translocating P-type ATPase